MSDSNARLIDRAATLRWTEIDPAARAAAATLLHDTLAVGAAGARSVHGDAVLAIARSWGTGDAASILGRPETRLPAASAAFVNAFQIHAQEFDSVHEAAVLHPMATVVAALLAEAERGAPASGERLLTAIVAGVDVAVTLGLAAPGPVRFFRPATAGIFGSVAAIANLRAMPQDAARDAFGHALAFAGGTMQAHVEGKPALPLQVAGAARDALLAVDLARAGIAGVRQPIDGPFGYLALFETGSALAAALALPGHRIAEVSVKPFPTGRAAHGGIGALRAMRADGVDAATLEAFDYRAPPLIARLVGRQALAGMEPGYARLCLPWLAAVALTRGTVGLADFARDRLDDPTLLALAARVTVTVDDNPDPAAFVPATATARLRGGTTVRRSVKAVTGSPELPLDAAERADKARACLEFAGLEACYRSLGEAIDRLAMADDAVAVIRASGIIAP